MNLFIEGLQGSGKSTLTRRICEAEPTLTPVMEGEYSPVELAWCAYVDEETYRGILDRYSPIRPLIEERSYREGDRRIICYTKIRTDIPGFYQDLEQHEIYNGRRSLEEFEEIVLSRYARWQDDRKIYECSIFQNTVEDMMLYRMASDEEILRFYHRVREALAGRDYRIVYLKTEGIRTGIEAVKRERTDDRGNEQWFALVCQFFNASPWAQAHGMRDFDGFVTHLQRRQELELRLCREVFPDRSTVLTAKKTDAFVSNLASLAKQG